MTPLLGGSAADQDGDRDHEAKGIMTMRKATRLTLITMTTLLGGAVLFTSAAVGGRNSRVERVDFGLTRTAVSPTYDARVKPVTGGGIKEFRIPMTHDTIEIAEGCPLRRLDLRGHGAGSRDSGAPGRSRPDQPGQPGQGHAPLDRLPRLEDPDGSRDEVDRPGRQPPVRVRGDDRRRRSWSTAARPPVLMHIAQGMYLPIIVDPQGRLADQGRQGVRHRSERLLSEGLARRQHGHGG